MGGVLPAALYFFFHLLSSRCASRRGRWSWKFCNWCCPLRRLPVAENEARALKSTEIEAEKGLNIFESSALPASNHCCQARQVKGFLPPTGGKCRAACCIISMVGNLNKKLFEERFSEDFLTPYIRGQHTLYSGSLLPSDFTHKVRDLMRGLSYQVKTVLEQCHVRKKPFLVFKDSPGNTLILKSCN